MLARKLYLTEADEVWLERIAWHRQERIVNLDEQLYRLHQLLMITPRKKEIEHESYRSVYVQLTGLFFECTGAHWDYEQAHQRRNT